MKNVIGSIMLLSCFSLIHGAAGIKLQTTTTKPKSNLSTGKMQIGARYIPKQLRDYSIPCGPTATGCNQVCQCLEIPSRTYPDGTVIPAANIFVRVTGTQKGNRPTFSLRAWLCI